MRKAPGCCAQEAAHSVCAQTFGGEYLRHKTLPTCEASGGVVEIFQPIPQAGMAPFPTDGCGRRGASVPSPLCVQITSPVAHCPLIHCSEKALSRPHALFQAKISAGIQNLCHQSLGDTISHPCGARQRGPTKPSINFLMWEAKKRVFLYKHLHEEKLISRSLSAAGAQKGTGSFPGISTKEPPRQDNVYSLPFAAHRLEFLAKKRISSGIPGKKMV